MGDPATAALSWTNWFGTQSCRPERIVAAADHAQVATAVSDAAERGSTVRVAGSGHSASPLCTTSGTLLILERMRGIVEVDRARRRVVALPATRIADLGEPLYSAGLALDSQSDIDTQQLAGAIATATHGSDVRVGSSSAAVRRLRLITATGEALEIGADDPELLLAAQVSMGMLGVVVEVELELTDAYFIRERTELWSWDEVVDRWDEAFAGNFSFFWLPTDASRDLFDLGVPSGEPVADRALVRFYEKVPVLPETEIVSDRGRRVDRAYRIYPYEFDPDHRELEYMVPFERGREAAEAVRAAMRERHPDVVLPVELRAVRGDDAHLSPSHGRDSAVIAVAAQPHQAFIPFLRAIDELLRPFDPRPHWGKIHFFDRERLRATLPAFDRFVAIRRRLDPDGVFLNEHLRELFA
jgi:FAD/FMN-containing dehydrogenase